MLFSTQRLEGISAIGAHLWFSIFVLAVISIFALWLLGIGDVESREPPVVRSRIPFIGHVISLLRYQNQYFDMISARCTESIYTIKIFSSRIYIVQSPELAQAAFRQSKEIDFNRIKVWGCRAVGYGEHGTNIAAFQPATGEGSYATDLHQEMYAALARGPNLLETNARVLNYLAKSLNSIGTNPESRRLFQWLRDEYTVGSAEALYGSPNPVSEDRSLIQSIWDFERDVALLVLDFFPSLTAPKGYAARAVVCPAFEEYYNEGLDENASALVKGRARAARRWGLTTKEIAKAEITIIMAAGTNTVPQAFYMICRICSRPDLVDSVRAEVGNITTRETRDGVDVVSLNISMLQTHCPLLAACFNETMRLTKTGASVRTILKDVMLNDQYLLQKGSFLQIPTGIMQSDPKIWGLDAKEFKPERWLAQDLLSKEAKKTQTMAFIPFGGGRNLCPGRHLAFTEITGFVAMLLYGFELSMSDGGILPVPKGGFQRLGVASISPEKELEVLVKRRLNFKGVVWEFNVGSA